MDDVLIVGGGPTGLATAITCCRFGVKPRIVERLAQPSGVSKALVVWAASLEAFEAMGVVEQFLAQGRRIERVRFGDGARELACIATGEGVDSPYPHPILLPQSATEALLAARLGALGGAIERDCELVALTQDAEGVSATLRHADGREEQVRARYLVGCDGARSTVRHALGIDFAGHTEAETFLLCDARIEGTLDPAAICIWWHGGGTIALFPVIGDVWRVFANRASADETPPTLAEMQDLVTRHGPPGLTLRDPSWLAAFRINDRIAERYRVARCFLAGDAAHIHSPAGGQGMNTGLQDGVNLGWKLAYALQGAGDPEMLLSSYEPERRPIAVDVVHFATRMLHFGFANAPLLRMAKDVALPLVTHIPAVRRQMQTLLSETANTYREGPLVALGGGGERAADVVLEDGSHLYPRLCAPSHTLLTFGDVAVPPALVGESLAVVKLPATGAAASRYGMARPGWVLIRPDQIVAARGSADELLMLETYAQHVLPGARVPM
jgi:2-polyprenyl-6-methoxyphenol hydroxylase-like FAD-dependent oxidoreductase